jgi:ribonuclease T1
MVPSKPDLSRWALFAAILAGLVLTLALAGCDEQPTPTTRNAAVPSTGPVSGLPAVLWVDLPPEAHDTIRLIDSGGPFPYDKDGATFGNREGLLPDRVGGYYKEYTVITPGSSDRGARRIVGGADGELYYTDDHYESFREVIR